MKIQAILWLLGCLPFSTACEQAVQLDGTVTIPVVAQRRFSEPSPGRLVVSARYARGGGLQRRAIFVLCDARREALVVPFHLVTLGCAEEIVVDAFIERSLNTGQRLACGPLSDSTGEMAGARVLSAKPELAFAGQRASSCRSGSARVALVLAVPPE